MDLELIECEYLLSSKADADRLPSQMTISVAPSHTVNLWTTTTLTLNDFALRMMQHESGEKAGSAWSPMTFASGRRRSANAIEAQLAVYDCDRGQSLQEIIDAVAERGFAAIITSSHSHGTERLRVPPPEWKRWEGSNPDKDAADFLLARGYRSGVARGAKVATLAGRPKIKKRGGVGYITIRHAPCPRFRVILFARSPWRAADYPTRQIAERVYKEGLVALARTIGLAIDMSAIDLARIFYDPRHRPGTEPEAIFVDGGLVDVWATNDHADGAEEDADLVPGDLIAARRSSYPFAVFADAVMSIRNDERFSPRNEWVKVLAAIHAETNGSDEGFELANRWSETWTEGAHDPGESRWVWNSLRTGRGAGDATGGTIIYLAKQDGWTPPQKVALEDRAPHGDVWNGVQFAARYRGRLRYVASTGQWLRWNGVRWVALAPPEVEAAAKEISAGIVDARSKEFRDNPNADNKSLLTKAIQIHTSLDRIRRIADSALSEPRMWVDSPADFDRDPTQLCVENGILDLKTGRLLAATSEQLVSKLAGTHFDPEARAPRFERFFRDVQPDPETRAFIQRAVGYTLTGLVDEEKMFFMYGTGANGKSVFANIIAELLGEYSVTLGPAIVARNKHENEAERLKARLPGARLALVNETAQGDMWDDQRVKELASRERLSARLLHREPFDFMPTHKLWIRGNHLPGALDSGHGFWRRLVPIHFDQQIDEAKMISDLDREIIGNELPGVLNWAIDGCREWQRHGLRLPPTIKAFANQYRDETDLLGQWFSECCVKDPTTRTPVGAAYQSYRSFCESQGVSPASQMVFSRMMTARNFRRDSDTSVRRYVGFSIKATHSEEFSDDDVPGRV